ncbi:MAG: nicotinate (nicotinamide) nucleotide adenylyltransferase [Gammaproteobacteria bacterium]|nr:MAG: nicotinate (nicotinamide) nucleotide adenylyltransferase [Gammaproteobacteria bacterium]
MNKEIQNIAIYGGAFDPVHNGHIEIIYCLQKMNKFSKIQLIPTFNPPHKEFIYADYTDRLKMLKILFKDSKNININNIEAKNNDKSWTIKTIEKLQQENNNSVLYLVMGGDSYLNFHQWHRYREILKKVRLLVFKRKNINIRNISIPATIIKKNITDISSAKIREALKNKKSVLSYIPTIIHNYIKENNLYE